MSVSPRRAGPWPDGSAERQDAAVDRLEAALRANARAALEPG